MTLEKITMIRRIMMMVMVLPLVVLLVPTKDDRTCGVGVAPQVNLGGKLIQCVAS